MNPNRLRYRFYRYSSVFYYTFTRLIRDNDPEAGMFDGNKP